MKQGAKMKILIICGGGGTRLWPISRTSMPKQFAPLLANQTLFQKTLKRIQEVLQILKIQAEITIITNEGHYFLALEQSEQIGVKIHHFLLESEGRDSAAAIVMGALDCANDEIILALPSDHIINDTKSFAQNIQEAITLAQQDKIVTFGITPTEPRTGYGYIHSSNNQVLGFYEKPSIEVAKQYLQQGGYFYNSGMFCFKQGTFLQECQTFLPEILKQCQQVYTKAQKEHHFIWLKEMKTIPKNSIDYALMEKTSKIAMVEGKFDWNDVGSFESLQDEFPKDANQNSSNTQLLAQDSLNNFVLANKSVSLIGISDLVVADTKDALLIATKGKTQEVKEIVTQLANSPLATEHSLTHRPWGSYEVLEESQFYKIKKIIVKPHKRLSLQKHFHRNEHWIVVSGTALIQNGEKEILLQSNQSTYIPMGTPHRLSNPGKLDLVLIEVQMGEYVGEDDIIRLEDDYHRA